MRYLIVLVCLLAFLIFGLLPGACVVAITDGVGAGMETVFWGFIVLCILGGLSSRR